MESVRGNGRRRLGRSCASFGRSRYLRYHSTVGSSPRASESLASGRKRAAFSAQSDCEECVIDLAQNDGGRVGRVHDLGDAADDLPHSDLRFVAEVEGLALNFWPRDGFSKCQVGVDCVLDVDVIADECAVAAETRPSSSQKRTNCTGDNARPI